MIYKSREDSPVYDPRDGDTLKSIAKREAERGNPITWQDLARYNWGTDDEHEIEGWMRDELGAKARGLDKRFVVSADDKPRGELRIPHPFTAEGLSVDTRHVLRVRRRSSPRQLLGSCSFPGVTFALESSFLRPSVVEYLKPVVGLAKLYPEGKFLIFGHTDASGSEDFNKRLSERRAWSVHAFITNDADAWEVLYSHSDEDWGVPVVQEILVDLEYYDGPVNGKLDSDTRAAMRALLGLPEGASVKNNADFRKALFSEYMASKHDIELGPDRFIDAGFQGCGEFNPVEEGEDVNEANRRVTVYLFHPERIPSPPCAYADCGPCKGQMVTRDHRWTETFSCSFYDSIARECKSEAISTIRLRLFDSPGEPMPGTKGRFVLGAYTQYFTADQDAYVELKVAGGPPTATVAWGEVEADGDDEFEYEHEVHLDYAEHPDETAAIMRRLHNIGYPVDLARALDEQPAPIVAFQLHYQERFELPEVNGKLDDETKAAIVEVHDNCDPTAYTAPDE